MPSRRPGIRSAISPLLPFALALLPVHAAAEATNARAAADRARAVDEILVVGARLPRPVSDVVGTVDVVTRDQLLDDMTVNVHDFVRYIPGVTVNEPDSRFGATEFSIRGLSGNRVVTLVDGVPLAEHFAIGAHANAGRDYLIPDAISRVELLRGPASTLFGTDALGGVIAVVTRDPDEYLHAAPRHLSGSATYSGADDSLTVSAALAGRFGDTSGVLHISQLNGNERAANGAARDPQNRTRSSMMAKVHRQLDSGDLLRAGFDWFDEEVETDVRTVLGYARFANTTHLLGDDRRQRRSAVVGYEFDRPLAGAERGELNAYVQRTHVDQHTDERRVIGPQTIDLWRRFDYRYDSIGATADFERHFDWLGLPHRLGWGLSANRTEIDQFRDGLQFNRTTGVVTNRILGESFPVRDFPRSTTSRYAGYVHDEIRIGSVAVIPAVRYEAHRLRASADPIFREDNPHVDPTDLNESALAPKLGLLWDHSDALGLYAQYARGFRAPPFQDVNIGFDLPQFNYRAIPNPDLRSEQSDGAELGARFRLPAFQASAALFGANYNDLIESRVNLGPDPETGTILFQSQNIERARIYGAELSTRLWLDQWLDGLELHAVAVWTRGENRQTGRPLNSVDPMELVTRLVWQRDDRLRLGLHFTAVAAPDDVDEARTPLFVPSGFAVVDLTAAWQVSDRMRLDIGVFNVFDREYWRWASVRHRPAGDPTLAVLTGPPRYASMALRVAL
jgi:hemoglobin/transferrin/lactoferrin receptor protein